ncbi:unnamed protein product [Lactuca saligna]|uniref:shikimate kinase n=1 Tax=Lactuca saligna TaxID=75948 RepID=A0AA35ZS46_LACSI|nr:unnamed protein product [Lactuca saligna]
MEAENSRSLNFTTCYSKGFICLNAAFGHGSPETKALCSPQQSSASAFQFECFRVEEDLMIKNKLEKIGPYLDGRCIYLVGMMGSGKTTVGQILSKILGYSFVDSDNLIEEVVEGIAVADIFKLHGEKFFREKETEVLRKLSSMHGSVISTGGGAVVQPINCFDTTRAVAPPHNTIEPPILWIGEENGWSWALSSAMVLTTDDTSNRDVRQGHDDLSVYHHKLLGNEFLVEMASRMA